MSLIEKDINEFNIRDVSTGDKVQVSPNDAIDLSVEFNKKQNTLISGTNLKTIAGITLLGRGDIDLDSVLNTVGSVNEVEPIDGNITLTPNDLGLDNTRDLDKPISILTQDALDLKQNILTSEQIYNIDNIDNKVDKVENKSLVLDTEIEKLSTLTNYDDSSIQSSISTINSILNFKANTYDLSIVATSGSYNDLLDKPTNLGLELGNTSTTAFRGDYGEIAYNTSIDNLNSINIIDTSISQLENDILDINNNVYNKVYIDNIIDTKQNNLVAGDNINIDSNTNTISAIIENIDYNNLLNKPTINDIEIINNLTTSDLLLDYNDLINLPTIPSIEGLVTTIELNTALDNKQDTLISNINIKTINNESILGSGNLEIEGIIDIVQELGDSTTSVMSQKAVSDIINKLMDKVFPVISIFETQTTLYLYGSTPNINLLYSLNQDNQVINPDNVTLNGVAITENPVLVNPTNTTIYNLLQTYNGIDYENSIEIVFNPYSYYGVINISENLNKDQIISLNEILLLDKNATLTFSGGDVYRIYSYPKKYGYLTIIHDNSLEYTDTYNIYEVDIDGEIYLVYHSNINANLDKFIQIFN